MHLRLFARFVVEIWNVRLRMPFLWMSGYNIVIELRTKYLLTKSDWLLVTPEDLGGYWQTASQIMRLAR